ncbi:hypothetical protein V6N13_061328 [Hibiscus sabdariffa]
MANSSSSAEGMPSNFNQAADRQRYIKIAAKNKWEERLNDLGWFRFAQQPARANLNWVLEFYTSNAVGEHTVTVRGRRRVRHDQGLAVRTRHCLECSRQEPKNHQPPTPAAGGKAVEHLCQEESNAHLPQSDRRSYKAGVDQRNHHRLQVQCGGSHSQGAIRCLPK